MILETLLQRRKDLDVTQEELSNLSGIALRTIKQIESGKGNPTLQTLEKIVDVLGFEISLNIKKLS